MLALAAAVAFQTANLPEKAMVSYTGIPSVSGTNIVVQAHNVSILLNKDSADISSLTLIKNNGPAGAVSIKIPQGRVGAPPLGVTTISATWANGPLKLVASANNTGPTATGAMKAGGSYALRIKYHVPLGRSGFDHKQLLAAYDLTSAAPIGTLMINYSYAPGVVFHLPEAGPAIGWQIGPKGAYLRQDNYDGKAGLSWCAFYPAGFAPIGH